MNWKASRVLVTGAGGFIGSHLVEALLESGAEVRAMVRYNSMGRAGWLDTSPRRGAVEVVAGDIRDPEFVERAVHGVDIVFHLAALVGIPYSYDTPRAYVDTNVIGSLNLLTAARQNSTSCVVMTSSSEVYGTAVSVPMREDHLLRAQSPYAASKLGADALAQAFHLAFGLPVVTLRPFNTFGPRQSARAIVPTVVGQLIANPRVRLGNTHPTRDFGYVSNTVDAFLAAATRPAAIGRTIHVGTGRECSVAQIVRMASDILGVEAEIEIDPARVRPHESEVQRLVADTTLAGELLGFTPAVTVEEGLRRTIDWIREHREWIGNGEYKR